MDDHVKIFWDERRKLYGGGIQFRSFARLLGGGGDKGEDLSGLLYLVGEQLIFEDFEKEGGFLGLFMKKFKGNTKKP